GRAVRIVSGAVRCCSQDNHPPETAMRPNRRIAVIAPLAAIAAVAPMATVARGATMDGGDTIANVAAAGKAGVARLQPVQAAMADAMSVMNRMSSDPAFQKSVLDFANKNDVAGLTAFLQRAAPNSTVSVKKLADFLLLTGFKVGRYEVAICVSNKSDCEN